MRRWRKSQAAANPFPPIDSGDGGADRDRTCDLLIANETLYQLSYDPIPFTAFKPDSRFKNSSAECDWEGF